MAKEITLQIKLSEAEYEYLRWSAPKYGYLRDDPRKRWTIREEKEQARFTLYMMVLSGMEMRDRLRSEP
jgi:hypothetical protein